MSIFSSKKQVTKTKKPEVEKSSVSETRAKVLGASHAPIRMQMVLKHPHVSEKTARGSAHHQYTFLVDVNANKNLIKEEIERQYKVDVLRVNTILLKGKRKRYMRKIGTQTPRKKAVVQLKEGQKIEIL